MSAQVSKGSTKPDSVDGRCGQPRRRHVGVEPDLEGLRRDGLHVPDHAAPALVLRQISRQTCGTAPDADAEHDEVEVAPDAQRASSRRGGGPNATRNPIPRAARRAPSTSCPSDGAARPAAACRGRRPAGRTRRRLHARLDVELQRRLGHVARASRASASPTLVQPVEEAEPHAAAPEHLVERREDDVAHAGLHLPEEGAAVGEEHPQRAAQRLRRRQTRGVRGIAVLVGEAQVVQAAQVARRPATARKRR